jgi:Dolichyl-phosphate-mannose-protein mannosyltransferase
VSDLHERPERARRRSGETWDEVSRDSSQVVGARGEYQRQAPTRHNTGPKTTGQLVALNHLEQIGGFQRASVPALDAGVARPQLARGKLEQSFSARPGRGRRHALLVKVPWPLLIVLVVQGWLASKLLRANTAFSDEALYLWAGHLEWAHWLDGAKIPVFPAYFSGSPVVYPPLGAVADSVGGLVGARLLSMTFMLGVTWLLWSTTSRLFGRSAGFFAAALFALLGPTLKLSAFATYDAMSLFFMALAAWCAVRAGSSKGVSRWMVIGSCALVISNAAAYSSAILDPIVIGMVLLTGWPLSSAKQAVSRAVALVAYLVAALILLFTIGGGLYAVGIDQTVLTRAIGTDSPSKVLDQAASWTGLVLALAVVGVVIALVFEPMRSRKGLLALLTAGALLVPIEQARIRTTTSLDKHVDIGVWFAAIAAGYAVSKLTGFRRPVVLRVLAVCLAAAALVVPARVGQRQAQALFHAWPNSSGFIAAMRPLVVGTAGNVLVETPSLSEYYLHQAGSQWQRWSTTGSIRLANGKSISATVGSVGNVGTYINFIKKRYFSVIAIEPSPTSAGFESKLINYLQIDPDYAVDAEVRYGNSVFDIFVLTAGHQ